MHNDDLRLTKKLESSKCELFNSSFKGGFLLFDHFSVAKLRGKANI